MALSGLIALLVSSEGLAIAVVVGAAAIGPARIHAKRRRSLIVAAVLFTCGFTLVAVGDLKTCFAVQRAMS